MNTTAKNTKEIFDITVKAIELTAQAEKEKVELMGYSSEVASSIAQDKQIMLLRIALRKALGA